jgi:hypothetical protein
LPLSQAGSGRAGRGGLRYEQSPKGGEQKLQDPVANFSLLYESIQITLLSAMEFATPDHQGKASSYRADDSYLTIKRLEVW